MDLGELEFSVGAGRKYGAVFGLAVRDPQSATLTTITEAGWARMKSTVLGQKDQDVIVQETSKAYTASKDTWVFLKTDGTYVYIEKTNNDPKPTQAAIDLACGPDALYIAKVVTDGTRVVDGGVTDMRQMAAHGEIEAVTFDISFEASETGALYYRLPYSGRVLAMDTSVYKALAGTDNGTVTLAIGLANKFTNVTGGLNTVPLSSAIGTRVQAAVTAAHLFRAGQTIRLTTAKTTAGGKANVTVYLEKRPK